MRRVLPNITTLLGDVRSGLYAVQRAEEGKAPPPPEPFVTVSRQAGARGTTFAQCLADHLNKGLGPNDRAWSVWDRALVEAAAHEHGIPESLVDSVEGPSRPWFEQFLADLFTRDGSSLDEYQLYRRLAITARGIARAGRAILVGRGAVYATRDLPGGVHVRLVAPLKDRIAHMAKTLNVSEAKAADEVRRRDHEREVFHRRFNLTPEQLSDVFTIGLNTGYVTDEQAVACVLPLISAVGATTPRPAVPAAQDQPAPVG